MKKHTLLVLITLLGLTLGVIYGCDSATNKNGLSNTQEKGGNGQVQPSIKDFPKAITVDPKSASAHAGRAALKYATGDHKGAIEDFTKAIELDKEYATAYSGRATAKYAEGDLNGAFSDAVTVARLMIFKAPGNN
ncbi:MAG: tetratricopeptide repeat protein [Chlorobiaceae bacterium]